MEKTMVKQMNPVNWFEIPVNDLQRAAKFYESLLGYQLVMQEMGTMKMAEFPMMQGMMGTTGSLVKGEGYIPSPTGSMVYFSVEDIDRVMDKVNMLGGKVLMPKMSIGEWGDIAQLMDTEGNRVALHQFR